MIANKVKLVIWDLDETFWRGTLSEEGIVPVDRNIAIVRELSGRGIVNSICSKNDHDLARAKLVELGIWDHFVFPSISFNPKGKAVAEMIEGAALRAENVLFIDDNRMNLEEVRFFNVGIMVAHPDDVLDGLLAHEHLAGTPDPELTRLKQYRFLQRKVEERSASELSNEEFLRASNIQVTIDPDVEANFERVVDLINRANQLNYTKRRLSTPENIDAFRTSLGRFGTQAGCVFAVDAYGDYGLIGFFLVRRRFDKNKLVHFVFSCRTMNMGIEQYVYEMLGRPDIEISEPVSYGLETHAAIDWIRVGDQHQSEVSGSTDRKFLLLGGCDLLQLASFCSANRLEFVNGCQDGEMVRYDDPGFILSDREALENCESIREFPCWRYEDALRFDEGLATSGIILVSLWEAMNMRFLRNENSVVIGMNKTRLDIRKRQNPQVFTEFEELSHDDAQKHAMIEKAFDVIAAKAQAGSTIFLLGAYTKAKRGFGAGRRPAAFNAMCMDYCNRHPESFRYIDTDALVPLDQAIGNHHFTRAGYHLVARHMLQQTDRHTASKVAAQ